jgi:hypothetical protein
MSGLINNAALEHCLQETVTSSISFPQATKRQHLRVRSSDFCRELQREARKMRAASSIFRPVATPFATRLKIRLVIQVDTHRNELGMFVQVIVVHRKLNFPPHPDRPRLSLSET